MQIARRKVRTVFIFTVMLAMANSPLLLVSGFHHDIIGKILILWMVHLRSEEVVKVVGCSTPDVGRCTWQSSR
jgi:hypothetical protein